LGEAVEGFTESLRLELNPEWNIKVFKSSKFYPIIQQHSQISIISPGAFKTRAHTTGTVCFPAPQAYDGEGLPSQVVRQWFEDGSGIRGDPVLAAKAIVKFSMLKSPPVRWAMGKDSIGGARAKIKQVSEETDQFENWSENLELVV
jgi:hypothetical protein